MQKLLLHWDCIIPISSVSIDTSSILVFDSSYLSETQNLIDISKAIQSLHSQFPFPPLIILNGSFAKSHLIIQSLAQRALSSTRLQIEHSFRKYTDIFLQTLTQIPIEEQHKKKIEEQLQINFKDILSLLFGISAVKEISNTTNLSLLTTTSHISALLILVILQYNFPKLHCTITNKKHLLTSKKLNSSSNIYILPVESHEDSIDFLASDIAVTHNASQVGVWSNLLGIQTADPKIITRATPIQTLNYTTALEISYLGGKFFHPSALYKLYNYNIPIVIYSHKTMLPLTTIHNYTTQKTNSCIAITYRNNFIMLTLRSTKMFNQYGFLEKIFSIYNDNKTPIETLTTSEISVTMTFHSKYYSKKLEQSLKKLGDIDYQDNQSIISLIGSKCWKDPNTIATMLQALHNIPIGMLSLGQTGTNLSIIISSTHLKKALTMLHDTLFLKNQD